MAAQVQQLKVGALKGGVAIIFCKYASIMSMFVKKTKYIHIYYRDAWSIQLERLYFENFQHIRKQNPKRHHPWCLKLGS